MPNPRRLSPADLLGIRDGSPANKDSRMTNCLMETNSGTLEIIKRPGYQLGVAPGTLGTGYGATSIPDGAGGQKILSIVDNKYYQASIPADMGSWLPVSTNLATIVGSNNTSKPNIVQNTNSGANQLWIVCLVDNTDAAGRNVYFSANGQTWSLVATDPFSLGSNTPPISTWCNNKIFACFTKDYSTNGAVYSSPDGATWSLVQNNPAYSGNIPSALALTGLITFNNVMYIIGSSSGAGKVYSSSDGNTWTSLTTTAGFNIRRNPLLFVLNNKIWLCGGYDGSTYFHDCWSSPDGITWTNAGNAGWSARYQSGFATLAGLVYLLGGTNAGGTLQDVWGTTNGSTWSQLATTTLSTLAPIGVVAGGNMSTSGMSRITAFGGSKTLFSIGQTESPSNLTVYKNQSFYTGQTPPSFVIDSGATPPAGTVGAAFNGGGTGVGMIDFSQNYARTVIAMKNSNFAWVLTIATNTMALVTDSNYPAVTVRGIAYLDGTFYVMDQNGTIYGSAANDFTTWPATSQIAAQCEPDGGVAIAKYGQYVVAFGNYTTEFFYDAGNATNSPLSPVQNSQFLIGCSNGDTIAQVASSLFWVAQDKVQGQATNRGVMVCRMQGLSYDIVSTDDVERYLNADSLQGAWGLTMMWLGHDVYMIVLPQSSITLVYDTDKESKGWFFIDHKTASSATSLSGITAIASYAGSTTGIATATWAAPNVIVGDGDVVTIAGANQTDYNVTTNITGNPPFLTFTYPIASIPVTATGTLTATYYTTSYFPARQAFQFFNYQIFQKDTTGELMAVVDTLYTDESNYIDMKIRTSRLERGEGDSPSNEPKFLPWVDIITDRSTANMLMRYTDDDYQTYVSYKTVSLATQRSRLTRLGSFFRRAFEFRHTDNSATRFQGVDIPVEQGTE